MLFSVVNGKTFPEHEVEKIFQIGYTPFKSYGHISIYM